MVAPSAEHLGAHGDVHVLRAWCVSTPRRADIYLRYSLVSNFSNRPHMPFMAVEKKYSRVQSKFTHRIQLCLLMSSSRTVFPPSAFCLFSIGLFSRAWAGASSAEPRLRASVPPAQTWAYVFGTTRPSVAAHEGLAPRARPRSALEVRLHPHDFGSSIDVFLPESVMMLGVHGGDF